MMFWNRKNKSNPYETRTITLDSSRVVQDPNQEIKKAIWALINNNCFPPRSPSFSDQGDPRPVRDVTVQTFYVVYSNDSRLINTVGRLSGDSIAIEIIREMVGFGATYEPYLIDKIGTADWQTAKQNDENNRIPGCVEAARDTRMIEVFLLPELEESRFEVRVVGRESLAVERSRLQKLSGKDPNVLAAISIGQSAFSNPHLREFLDRPQANRLQSRPIYIMEGRNAREFVVGPNIYDDIRVPGMPNDQWYVLRINSSEAHQNVVPQLKDWASNQVPPGPSGTKWSLKGKGEDGNSEWFCDISLTQCSPAPISSFPDAHEVPPSIQIVGRVLPKTTARRKYMPEAVEREVKGATPKSGFTLEPNLHVYSINDDDPVYLLNLDQRKSVSVATGGGNPITPTDRGYQLEDDAVVTVGSLKYRWESRNKAGSTLPAEVVGVLFDAGDPKDRSMEYLLAPFLKTDPTKWFIGNWRTNANAAFDLSIAPIFRQNPDSYLAHAGNLVISYDNRDSQGRPRFKLSLRKVANELLLIARTDQPWRAIEWPDFQDQNFYDIPDVAFIGEGNALIFGTTYYGIKTSGTLRS